MTITTPMPDGMPNLVFNVSQNIFAIHFFVVVTPSAKNRIKMPDYCRRWKGLSGFQPSPYFLQEGLDLLFLRSHQTLSVITTHVEAQEIEAVCDVHNSGLLCV